MINHDLISETTCVIISQSQIGNAIENLQAALYCLLPTSRIATSKSLGNSDIGKSFCQSRYRFL